MSRRVRSLFGLLLMAGGFSTWAAERDITIEDLVTLRDILTTSLSPNGEYVAFQTLQRRIDSNGLLTEWHIAATQADARVQTMATGDEPVRNELAGYFLGSDIVWSPDSQSIYFTKKLDDSIQVWRGSIDTPEARQITRTDGDVLSLQFAPDGAQLYFTMGRSHAEIAALRRQGAREGYLQQDPPLYYFAHGPMIPNCTNGKARFTQANEQYACRLSHWVYETHTEVVRRATEAEVEALPEQDDSLKTIARMGVQLSRSLKKMQTTSPDGTKLAWIENQDPELYTGAFPPMVLTVADGKATTRCPAPECIAQDLVGFGGLWWHPNGEQIIFKANNDSHHSLTAFYRWTPGEETVRTILRSDDTYSSCEQADSRLICGHETWTSPRRIVALALESGDASTIVDPNPEFQDIHFTRVEKILGADDDGHKVYGHLVYPKNYEPGQAYPLIVTQYHSYGFLHGATGNEQPIHVYARDGIAVLSFDHRQNHAEHTRTSPYPGSNAVHFKNLLLEQRPATAVENMVGELVRRGIADPERVGITGFSYGDQVLSTLLMRRNYAAASSGGLPSVPVNHMMAASGATATAYNEIFGEPFSPKGLKMRLKYSLAANAAKIDTPIVMHITDKETYAFEAVYNALHAAGKPIEMYTYPDELHVKWQPAHNAIIYRRNLDWFNFWLRNAEDPDLEKVGQYERWRRLRKLHQANLAK